jgi:transcriptional regulator with XRE-family HTH domain
MSVTFRRRAVDAGRERSRYLRRRFGAELRTARVVAGLTQSLMAGRAGVSQSFASSVERGTRGATLEVACRLVAAVGCELGMRLYPADGVSLRDSGQLGVAEAIVARAHASWHARLEVPISPGDRRAADLVLEGQAEILHVEIERSLADLQAQIRSASLKRDKLAERYDRPVRLIIAVPDRAALRRIIRQLDPLVSRTFRIGSRPIAWAIAHGGSVDGDGILFVQGSRWRQRTEARGRP